jgi:hypothetical protein
MPYKQYLKIKAVSLTAEAKLIRKDEIKMLKASLDSAAKGKTQIAEKQEAIFKGLQWHRIWDVRNEARITNIAYGFLRGHEYKDIERNTTKEIRWSRVEGLVLKYGEGDIDELHDRFLDWKKRAREYFREVALARLQEKEEKRLAKLEPVVTEDMELNVRIVPRRVIERDERLVPQIIKD